MTSYEPRTVTAKHLSQIVRMPPPLNGSITMPENKGAGFKARMEAQDARVEIRDRMSRVKHKLIVMSGKGGVGKSTIAVNLAAALAMRGNEVGLLDLDLHGPDVPKMLGIEDERPDVTENVMIPVSVPPHLKVISMGLMLPHKDAPIIWRGPLKMGAIREFLGKVEWGELDYLIIDMPPGTGDEPLSTAQLIRDADGAIIVTTPQDVALLDSRKSVQFARKLGLKVIGIIENMSGMTCPHCGKEIELFKKGGGEAAAKELDVPFLGRLPMEPGIVSGGDEGKPFSVSDEDTEAARAFDGIVETLETSLGK